VAGRFFRVFVLSPVGALMLPCYHEDVGPARYREGPILSDNGELLPRQPLRYLLVDDPGAGKPIMAGLLIIGDAQKQMLRS
jgi:hypothetical protein